MLATQQSKVNFEALWCRWVVVASRQRALTPPGGGTCTPPAAPFSFLFFFYRAFLSWRLGDDCRGRFAEWFRKSTPNPAFFQYVQITAINSSTAFSHHYWSRHSKYDYLSTWPNYSLVGLDYGGPATLYVFSPNWPSTIEWQGITFTSTNQLDQPGRDSIFRDTTFTVSGQGRSYADHECGS